MSLQNIVTHSPSAAVAAAAIGGGTSSSSASSSLVAPLPEEHISGLTSLECFGHRYHWLELVYIIFLITSFITLLLSFAKAEIPIPFYTIAAAVLSFSGLIIFWNYYLLKTLAASAEKLKGIVTASRKSLEVQTANNRVAEETNNKLAKSNAELQNKLTAFKKEVGLLDLNVKDLNAVEHRLSELYNEHKKYQENERKLNEEQESFLLRQQEERLIREKRSLKLRLRDQFEDADFDRDGALSTVKEMTKMKEFLARAGIVVEGETLDINGDGKVRRWELMEVLDKLLDAHYQKLIEELRKKKGELRKIVQH